MYDSFFFELLGVNRDQHVRTHSVPTRRSSNLVPADWGQAERGAAVAHQLEQARCGVAERLGRPVEAAMDMAMDIMLARYRRDSAAQRRFGLYHRFGSRRAHVDAQDRAVGHDIIRSATVDRKSTRLNSSH